MLFRNSRQSTFPTLITFLKRSNNSNALIGQSLFRWLLSGLFPGSQLRALSLLFRRRSTKLFTEVIRRCRVGFSLPFICGETLLHGLAVGHVLPSRDANGERGAEGQDTDNNRRDANCEQPQPPENVPPMRQSKYAKKYERGGGNCVNNDVTHAHSFVPRRALLSSSCCAQTSAWPASRASYTDRCKLP